MTNSITHKTRMIPRLPLWALAILAAFWVLLVASVARAETPEQTQQRHRRAQAQSCQPMYLDGQRATWDPIAGVCRIRVERSILVRR
jgi:hypothetical protein